MEPVGFRLGSVVDGVANLFKPEAQAKGLDLTVELPPEIADKTVSGDSARLGQVLNALVGNAIKFTSRGSVGIRMLLLVETPVDIEVRFEVEDTGIGIAPENLKRIFDAFQQVDGSLTREYGGTGLGLAICKRLAVLMGGDVGVRSLPGAGSTFWFTSALTKKSDLTA